MNILIRSIFAVAALLMISCIKEGGGGGGNTYEATSIVKVGDALPDFTAKDEYGSTLYSYVVKSRKSLIVFFDTGCQDCQRELPLVESLYQMIKGNNEYVVVPIARGQQQAVVDAYWRAQEFEMPYYLDDDRSAYALFATSYVPRLYISDANGKVLWLAVEKTGFTDPASLLRILDQEN